MCLRSNRLVTYPCHRLYVRDGCSHHANIPCLLKTDYEVLSGGFCYCCHVLILDKYKGLELTVNELCIHLR